MDKLHEDHLIADMADFDLYSSIFIGSHGFVQLKEVFGDENRILDAARISYDKDGGERDPIKDRHLIRYLMRNRHTTPFEQVEMVFVIQIPMDAWRQMIRHRTANVNEYSTRYTEAIDDNARTCPDKWRTQSKDSKQGSEGFIHVADGQYLTDQESRFLASAHHIYQQRLTMGVAKEQARKDLPLSTYTRAYWKCDLHNLLHYLSLRLDPHAQLEIREYANVIARFVKQFFPWTWEAFEDYRLNAITLTGPEVDILHDSLMVVDDEELDALAIDKLGSREHQEFEAKLTKLGIGMP